jgi:endonuclease-3 related protein
MNSLEKLYWKLKSKYPQLHQQWQLWCKWPKTEKEKEEIIIGAILTQRTNWQNVEKAINNLRNAHLCSLCDIKQVEPKILYPLIKPVGFYRTKAEYLREISKFIVEKYRHLAKMAQQNLFDLRKELLSLRGVGKETADSILLYALEKPIFVIDEYTKRLAQKEGLSSQFSYDALQKLFESQLKKEVRLFQEFHALIVIEGKNH